MWEEQNTVMESIRFAGTWNLELHGDDDGENGRGHDCRGYVNCESGSGRREHGHDYHRSGREGYLHDSACDLICESDCVQHASGHACGHDRDVHGQMQTCQPSLLRAQDC